MLDKYIHTHTRALFTQTHTRTSYSGRIQITNTNTRGEVHIITNTQSRGRENEKPIEDVLLCMLQTKKSYKLGVQEIMQVIAGRRRVQFNHFFTSQPLEFSLAQWYFCEKKRILNSLFSCLSFLNKSTHPLLTTSQLLPLVAALSSTLLY